MARTVIDIAVGCDGSSEGDHAAMVRQLHEAVSRICPGITREALERMLTPALGTQALDYAAEARTLEKPKGSA